jgi:hypothetical protein
LLATSTFLYALASLHFKSALAGLHFNENIHRDCKKSKRGEKYFRVTYPKFKLGKKL